MRGEPFGLPAAAGLSAAETAAVLGLVPHREGGFFRETYRSPVMVPTPAGRRSLATAIFYLLTVQSPSRFHRLRFDEVWFHHAGAPVEMFLLGPGKDDGPERVLVGPDRPQMVVPGGRWMAARVAEGLPHEAGPQPAQPAPPWALVGCVVSPGFEYEDFELGDREALLTAFPSAAAAIRSLT